MLKLEGIIAAMVTPMIQDEKIDEKGMRLLINRLINAGVHGLFCLGTTGEFYALSMEEKEFIINVAVDETRGRVPVYAGTGATSTQEVIELTKHIRNSGVQAVSVITPYFITPNQEQLYTHYKIISESVDLPVIMYNIPGRTGIHLEPDTVEKLAGLPNIIGIKDSSGKFDNIKAYIDKTAGMDFTVLAGTDALICRTLEAGGKGAISATTNIIPELVVSIYEYFRQGKLEDARVSQQKLVPLSEVLKLGTVPGVLKQAVNIAGVPVGPARKPVDGLYGDDLEKLTAVIKSYYS